MKESLLRATGLSLVFGAGLAVSADAGSALLGGVPAKPSWSLLEPHRVGMVRGTKANRHGTHVLFAQSAIPLEAGEGYYKNTLLSLNAVNYGLTRHFSVGGGVELISILTGRDSGPVYFANAKLAANLSEVLHMGLNAFYINYPFPANLDDPQYTGKRPGFGALMGSVTIGDPDFQVTLSGGVSRDLDADKQRPVFCVSGMARLFPRMAVITENWLFLDDPDDYSLYSYGVRFIGQTVAVDVALVNNKQIREEVLAIGLPIVGVTVAF
jgi:hypothetical protein